MGNCQDAAGRVGGGRRGETLVARNFRRQRRVLSSSGSHRDASGQEWGTQRSSGSSVAADPVPTAGAVILGCAAAIVIAPSAPGWWRPLAIVGAASGLGAFAVFYDGQVRLLAVEGAIGAVVSLILLVTAIAIPGSLQVALNGSLSTRRRN